MVRQFGEQDGACWRQREVIMFGEGGWFSGEQLVLLGAVVQVAGLAAFPTAYHLVYGEPLGDSALRA